MCIYIYIHIYILIIYIYIYSCIRVYSVLTCSPCLIVSVVGCSTQRPAGEYAAGWYRTSLSSPELGQIAASLSLPPVRRETGHTHKQTTRTTHHTTRQEQHLKKKKKTRVNPDPFALFCTKAEEGKGSQAEQQFKSDR